MKKISLALVLLAGAAAPSLAETTAEKTGANSALGIAPKTADFVSEAAISDMFEIQSSQQRSDDATKKFAAKMIADHEKVASEMKPLAASLKVAVPVAMDSSHQKMLDQLKGMQGPDFTKQYHKDQYSAHKDAVALYQRYAKGGNDEQMKALAAKTLPTLQEHEKMASDLDK